MKEVDTIPGKSYSVHSTSGCTVSDDSGWSKTLEAPEDYFTAHSGKVYIDDDTATVRELFKLAPYQKLRLLGVVGGNKLPYGYTRLAYLESTGTQYIGTGRIPQNEKLKAKFSIIDKKQNNYVAAIQLNTRHSGWIWRPSIVAYSVNVGHGVFYLAQERVVFDFEPGIVYSAEVDFQKAVVDGQTIGEYNVPLFKDSEHLSLFAYSELSLSYGLVIQHPSKVRIYEFELYENEEETLSVLPCLDSTGTPCMYDTVTRKPFYNSGTGTFIAGVENQVQLNNLLRKLPDRTGLEVGTLQVRLAEALQTEANLAALDAMVAKNWEISQAA